MKRRWLYRFALGREISRADFERQAIAHFAAVAPGSLVTFRHGCGLGDWFACVELPAA